MIITNCLSKTNAVAGMCDAFGRLDELLREAIAAAQIVFETNQLDPYCGLHIQPEEVFRLLSQPPGKPLLWVLPQDSPAKFPLQDLPFDQFSKHFNLSPFDIDVILIALAPEVDLRYERIYAFLQNDVTRRQPSVDLVLNILCQSTEEKLLHQSQFSHDAPLVQSGLIVLKADNNHPDSPLLSQFLTLDKKVARWLLGDGSLDAKLQPFCECVEPAIKLEGLFVEKKIKTALLSLSNKENNHPVALKLYLHGRDGVGKRSIAEALALQNDLKLLRVNLSGEFRSSEEVNLILMRLKRESWFQKAMLFIENIDAISAEKEAGQFQCLLDFIENHEGPLVLSGKDAEWVARRGLGSVSTIFIGLPSFSESKLLWKQHLTNADVEDADLDILARNFRLTPGQIAIASRMVTNQSIWNAATGQSLKITLQDLMGVARAQSGHLLNKLARKVGLTYRWEDLILPDDQSLQLREICFQFSFRNLVYSEWGFDRRLSLGRGLNVLFAGPPGTGKTMAAEVIASEIGLDLYKIDLSQVVSKYIGETEKNLNSIFSAAEDANSILFFDEADALFGKRSEVKDAHDRYANIEVGYLLQKMEEYEGIAILATNLRNHLDDAFVRRMQFIVEFPFPDETYRRKIWEGMFPQKAPLDADVDFQALARDIRVAGGNIKNIGLASAFYAASDGGKIQMRHLLKAAQREHQKLGRSWNGLNGT
jgi:SpoVK/Ycf46/Vps4 family AAA+-type ATPase